MKRLQLIVCATALVMLEGCATTRAAPEDESILDVLDTARYAPPTSRSTGCAGSEIPWCVSEGAGIEQCKCMDSIDIQQRLSPYMR